MRHAVRQIFELKRIYDIEEKALFPKPPKKLTLIDLTATTNDAFETFDP
jgi:hypothetical protein